MPSSHVSGATRDEQSTKFCTEQCLPGSHRQVLKGKEASGGSGTRIARSDRSPTRTNCQEGETEIFSLLCLRTEYPQGNNFTSLFFFFPSVEAYLDHVSQGSEAQQP